ncbi:MAG: hypothetical protein LUH07_11785 [Lachnospiraceae bacterium]|nr:hypothetical protein [Lachnospiraceae bacterium]
MEWCEVNGELKRNRLVGSFSSKDETSIFCEVGNRLRNRTLYGPFAKLYKRDIIEKYGLRFPNDLRIGEDAAFVFSYSLHISSFEASDTILYFANIESEESLSRKKRPYLQKDLLAGSEIMLKALSECSLSQETKKFFIMRLHGAIIEMCIP